MKTDGAYIGGYMNISLVDEDILTRTNRTVRVPICRQDVPADVSGDHIIPEYMPEIRKLIKIDVRVSTPGRFISGNEVRVGGGIEYCAVYVGSDGKLYCAELPAEYEISAPLDENAEYDVSENITVFTDVVPEAISGRVLGARKINIKCHLSVKVKAFGGRRISNGELPNESHFQKLVKNHRYYNEIGGSNDNIELKCEIEAERRGARYVCADCRVFVEEARSGEGYVECKGYALIKILLWDESTDEPCTVKKRLPFNELVELDGCKASTPCCAYGACFSIRVEDIEADAEGYNEGARSVRVGIRLNATSFTPENMEYIKDAYSTDRECTFDVEKYELISYVLCKNGNMTFSASVDCEGTAGFLLEKETNDIIDVVAYATCENAELDNDKCVINGSCRFNVVYPESVDGESADILSSDIELPFKYEFPKDGELYSADGLECTVIAIDPIIRLEGGKATFSCELVVSYRLATEKTLQRVGRVRYGEAYDRKKSGFTVYYPEAAESLWSIAKKYKASVEKVALENDMDDIGDSDSVGISDGRKYIIV